MRWALSRKIVPAEMRVHFHFISAPNFEAQNADIEVNGLFRITWHNFHVVNSFKHHLTPISYGRGASFTKVSPSEHIRYEVTGFFRT
jgi:hypothetical protein